jgi:hypothetical protein
MIIKMTQLHNTEKEDRKHLDHWRIVIGNINSFPDGKSGSGQHKQDMLHNLVVNNDSDIVMISEHNKNINNIRYTARPGELMKKWWPRTITRMSYLSSDNKSTFEPGGTMIITHSRSTAQTCDNGEDSHLLGRWNYITIRGKKEYYTTIISIYRPSKTQETYMRHTAYSAARRKHLPNYVTPDELWYLDLKDLIKEKLDKQHEV